MALYQGVNLQLERFYRTGTTQSRHTTNMLTSVSMHVTKRRSFMTIEAGDIVPKGTQCGLGTLSLEDTVSVTIEDIGTLSHPIGNA